MQRVFVVDKHRQPLMPCHPARARKLLNKGKAAVLRQQPFTIILIEREGGETQPTQVKIDPGSKTTGIALVADFKRGLRCIWAAELTHRGQQVHNALLKRRQQRRTRRSRKTRYRPARFNNRRREQGVLSPSLQSRVDNILTWVKRLRRFAPITRLAMELTRFDTQKMQNPEISGIEYQQGTLQGYEVREYLLEKWGRQCAYCGKTSVPLEVEHIVPQTRGGSQRVPNLTIACEPCNRKKGNQTAAEFGYPEIQAQAKQPLKDAAVVNATRRTLYEQLKATGLSLEVGTGARTKYNRIRQGYPKTHWLDAVCVGDSGEQVFVHPALKPLIITATGRQSRQMCRVDKFGFPRTSAKQQRMVNGFQTGDMVKAVVTVGKKTGTYMGRVAIRASGSFNIKTKNKIVQGIGYQYCQSQHRSDGYDYSFV
ncbi:MAG: RNA-guided endonuclease IscB [Chloroflexi bacterium]|nr:RNA-guided endonuclease IscB [Chloroflexota bacterium]